eukprot:PITA_16659
MASCMLHAKSLPHKLWAEALNCVNYIQSRSPHRSIKNQTPFEAWSNTKPEITHLRVFGSRAWAQIPSEKRKALDPQSIECIFVGYPNGVKGYRLLIPSTNKLIIERSVKFEESLSHAPQSPHADTFYLPHVRDDDSVHSDADTDHADAETQSSDTNLVHANDDPHPSLDRASSSESYSPVINQRTRSLREIYAQDQPAARNGLVGDNSDLQRTSSKFIEPPLVLVATEPSPSWHCHLVQSSDPQSYAEVAGHPAWESAMEEEYNSLLENQTWDLVPLPSGRKLVRCKWVYRTKSAADGKITRRKARLVAKGFQQVHDIDYDETFAPVAKMDSIRLTLAIAATQQWEVDQMDVKNAFLHGDLSEEIYMEQPHGFIQDSSLVCRLKKSLYGLKQAPRAWYAKMDSFLLSQNFERCKSDPNVYMLRTHDSLLILVLYVDDLLITGSSASAIATVKRALHDRFLMTDMGPLHFFLGLEISQDATGIKLSQAKYARDLLERFRMADCKPARTPFLSGVRLEDGGDTPLVDSTLYRQLEPHELHWNAAKRILRYVQGTITFGIHYAAGSALNLLGFTDSDWVGDNIDRKSTSGYSLSLGSGPICWSSKKQAAIALSSADAEYRGVVNITIQDLWLQHFLTELGVQFRQSIVIWCDNQSTLKFCRDPVQQQQTKHIEIHMHYIRDLVHDQVIDLQFCPSVEQIADIFTKTFTEQKFRSLHDRRGVKDIVA